ncbi:MAG TPA: hypothetical protein VK571_06945 [Gemmatimonadaceae bacterium]|nr:hypothetical protein [Gemmatimonadaceae bacterium]
MCSAIERGSEQYQTAVDSAERMLGRADGYFTEMRVGHAAHERVVRVVLAALVEARTVVTWLTKETPHPDDLSLQAEKIERAIDRAEAAPTTPPAAST